MTYVWGYLSLSARHAAGQEASKISETRSKQGPAWQLSDSRPEGDVSYYWAVNMSASCFLQSGVIVDENNMQIVPQTCGFPAQG